MLDHITRTDGFFAAMVVFVIVWYVTPTTVALARGVSGDRLLQVMLFNVIPVGWPAALILALLIPGRVRDVPIVLPREAGYPPDPRYPRGDPRAQYPLP